MSGKKTLKQPSGKRVHVERGSAVPFVTVNNGTRKLKYRLPINLMQPKNVLRAKLKNKANTEKNKPARPTAAPTVSSAQLRKQQNAEKRRILEARQREMARMQKAQEEFMAAARALRTSVEATRAAPPPPVPANAGPLGPIRTMANFTSFLNKASRAAKEKRAAKSAAKLRGENSSSSNNE